MASPHIHSRVYTIREFVTAYRISRTRLYAEINSGRLIARRFGGRTLIARDDAEAWLAALPSHRPCERIHVEKAA